MLKEGSWNIFIYFIACFAALKKSIEFMSPTVDCASYLACKKKKITNFYKVCYLHPI
jgi:hypothetical protein